MRAKIKCGIVPRWGERDDANFDLGSVAVHNKASMISCPKALKSRSPTSSMWKKMYNLITDWLFTKWYIMEVSTFQVANQQPITTIPLSRSQTSAGLSRRSFFRRTLLGLQYQSFCIVIRVTIYLQIIYGKVVVFVCSYWPET